MISDVIVFCDKPTDAKLFKYLKGISPILSQISDKNIHVLPDRNSLAPEYIAGFGPLLEYDRADYYFCFAGKPFLVIEMTEHGYTGDQCLQRFARIAKTAELGIPFIYFAPLSRTRYDELDNDNPSYRNVSADMYNGFVRLSEIYSTPVVAIEWGTGDNGIPLILGADEPEKTGITKLFGLVSVLLSQHFEELIEHQSIIGIPEIQQFLDETQQLSQRENVRTSDVKKEGVSFKTLKNIISSPRETYNLIPRDYFYKGKSFKLLAVMSIDRSVITKAILPNGSEITIEEFFKRYEHEFSNWEWLYFYSGYQWRSEPNVGIVTNVDINLCREKYGKTIYDRKQLLCVHWPRIFWNKESPVRTLLQRELINKASSPVLNALVKEVFEHSGKEANVGIIGSGPKVFGAWSNRATVARIYRSVCDLIILNDAIIVGDKWGKI